MGQKSRIHPSRTGPQEPSDVTDPAPSVLTPCSNAYADILTRFEITPEFHEVFATFVETGETSDGCAEQLQTNPRWNLALECAFERRIGRLGESLRILRPKTD